ncbi:Regulator of sigma E protease [Gammaproteobacteria bacterium]
MTDFLFTIAAFLLALSVLISVHEWGHFWVARRVGVKVLVFSLGFGTPLWTRQGRDGTEYRVATLPLGGYVKMLDEREGPVSPEEQARTFNRQPVWKRAAIVAAGPLCNLLFAVIAFWLTLMLGEEGLKPILGDVKSQSPAAQAGFQPGDQLLRVADRPTPTWEAAIYALLTETLEPRDLTIQVQDRQGNRLTRTLERQRLKDLSVDEKILEHLGVNLKRLVLPPIVGQVVPGEPGDRAGLRSGDRLLAIDGHPVESWSDWVTYVRARPGQPIALRIDRDGATFDVTLNTLERMEEGVRIGRVGVGPNPPSAEALEAERAILRLPPGEALWAAGLRTWDMSWLMLRVAGKMLTGDLPATNLSGPIAIAESAGRAASVGYDTFLKFLAVVSISLGVLNLLPIPVLDGGLLVFLALESILGRPLPEWIEEQAQKVGIAMLGSLMLLALYTDLSRLWGRF